MQSVRFLREQALPPHGCSTSQPVPRDPHLEGSESGVRLGNPVPINNHPQDRQRHRRGTLLGEFLLERTAPSSTDGCFVPNLAVRMSEIHSWTMDGVLMVRMD
jgi:hypothetical protein